MGTTILRSTETVQASNDPSKVTDAEMGKAKSQRLVHLWDYGSLGKKKKTNDKNESECRVARVIALLP